MKIFLLIIIIFLFSQCSEKKKTIAIPVIGETKILSVIKMPDSTKRYEEVLRVIQKIVVVDSISGDDIIVYDTMYGRSYYPLLLDSMGKPIIDSVTKLPKRRPNSTWIKISKDSVIWKIQNIPVDSILKM